MIIKRQKTRRYLVPINTVSTQQLFTDCVVVGSGVAGLRAAIELDGATPEILADLARAQLALGDIDDARATATEALEALDDGESVGMRPLRSMLNDVIAGMEGAE